MPGAASPLRGLPTPLLLLVVAGRLRAPCAARRGDPPARRHRGAVAGVGLRRGDAAVGAVHPPPHRGAARHRPRHRRQHPRARDALHERARLPPRQPRRAARDAAVPDAGGPAERPHGSPGQRPVAGGGIPAGRVGSSRGRRHARDLVVRRHRGLRRHLAGHVAVVHQRRPARAAAGRAPDAAGASAPATLVPRVGGRAGRALGSARRRADPDRRRSALGLRRPRRRHRHGPAPGLVRRIARSPARLGRPGPRLPADRRGGGPSMVSSVDVRMVLPLVAVLTQLVSMGTTERVAATALAQAERARHTGPRRPFGAPSTAAWTPSRSSSGPRRASGSSSS